VPAPTQPQPLPTPARAPAFQPFAPYRGLVRRFLVVHRHLFGLAGGGLLAYVRVLPPERKRGRHALGARLLARLVRPLVDRQIGGAEFPEQLRRRLELLGPTYVKLGQIMAIRSDLLPAAVCRELENLFDRLPPISFAEVETLIGAGLGRPARELFRSIEPAALGSASIAQVHRAVTHDGAQVVVKVMKPGIRTVIETDLQLLRILGALLQKVIPRYQPRQIIREFSAYTIREVDFTYEADNAETFIANFRDTPDVIFPRINRELSSASVLTMEFLEGSKPGTPATLTLPAEERARLIDLGAASIIRMLYQDGFFHADLHAGNLLVLAGDRPRVGFIDLGMVGRFEERTKRRMLYYYHALVTGDIDGAAKFLTEMATIGAGGDAQGFRRAVIDLSRRFLAHASRGDFSIAQLILESVGLGGKYRVFFPVEMTLMVKALVTFEGVGRMLDPTLDVAAVSRKHISQIYLHHFSPNVMLRELLRGAPELVDLAVQLPQLLSSGAHHLEETLARRAPPNPLAGVRSSILAAACIVGGVIAMIQDGSTALWLTLFGLAVVLTAWGR
jgi:ubiquinone biosynthesis protein